MKTFEQMTEKQLKKEIIAWETSMGTEPKHIDIVGIGQDDDDAELYEQSDGHTCQHFWAAIVIDGAKLVHAYEWDCDEEEITAGWNPQDLPSNVVARLEYAGQALDTLELNPLPEVDVNGKLPYAVTYIRMNYPFKVGGGGLYNVYKIAPANTWGELLTEIIKVFQREYEAGKTIAPHVLSDYVIERVDVHPNDLVTVLIGS